MSADFDPYHVWLGIPPDEQPANRYRLLGIRVFESNPEVIDSAADRQSAHLRTFQGGKHGTITQRLLNEVAAARVCLLNPQTKATYDEQLRWPLVASKAQPPAPRAATAQPESRLAQPASAPVAQSIDAARAQPSAPSTGNWDELIGPHEVKASKSSGTIRMRASAAQSNTKTVLLAVGGALLAAAAVAVLIINSNAEAVLTFDWPAADRVGAALAIDGEPVAIPTSGPWEFHCQPGEHRIVATRPAFRFSRQVEVSAGDKPSITPDWKPKAMLVLNWPLAERTGATLTDDGQRVAVSAREPFELAVAPGRHVLRVGRANAPPVETVVTVADDQRQSVALTLRHAGTLRVNWPIADRQDGKLTIDGKEQPIASRELAFPLDPGQHSVRLYRDGFEPIEETVEVSDGPLKPVMPIWVRQKTYVAASGDTPVATAAAPQQTASIENSTPTAQKGVSSTGAVASQNLPVPAAADQKRIAAQIDQDFKPTSAPDDERRVAAQLFALADKSGTPADERYVALVKAIGWAAKAGDFASAMQGIDRLADTYEIDPFEMKRQTIEDPLKVGPSSPERAAAALGAAEQAVDEAVDASRFDRALALCDAASKAAGKLASASGAKKEAVERIARRRGEIAAMQTASAAAVQAQSTLEKDPDNAEANSALGRWYCFFKGDWDRGLRRLAKGKEAALKSLAERELAVDLQLKPQLGLADGWWEVAQKETGLARDSLRLHASEIYRLMLPNLQPGIKKTAIEKRLAEAEAIQQTPGSNSEFPHNRWIDVLSLVNTAKHAVKGSWSRNGAEISCEPEEAARVEVPVAVNGSYDLEVEFTRNDGDSDVTTVFTIAGRQCGLLLSMDRGAVSGVECVDGKFPHDDGNPIVVRPGTLTNGHRYKLLINVRLMQPDRASADVSLDGKPYLPHWEGNPASLSNYEGWGLPETRELGLGGFNTRVTFHSMRLKLVAGQAINLASKDGSELKAPAESHRASQTGFAHGQWVDLLRMVDPTTDAVRGKWTREREEISCKPEDCARIKLPVIVDGGYDLEVEFTRTEAKSDVTLMLPVGPNGCAVMLSAIDGKVSGLEYVDGHGIGEEGSLYVVRPGTLENGRRYKLLTSVRLFKDGTASIDVSLNGKPYLPHWQGRPASLNLHMRWILPNVGQPGLGAWKSAVTFHSARLRMISGEAIPESELKKLSLGPTIMKARDGHVELLPADIPLEKLAAMCDPSGK